MKALKWMIGACFTIIVINFVFAISSSNYDPAHAQRMGQFAVLLVPLIAIYGIAAIAKKLFGRSEERVD